MLDIPAFFLCNLDKSKEKNIIPDGGVAIKLKKNPVTPEGLKIDWAEVKPRMQDLIKNFSGDEWFVKLLITSKEWIDAELEKPEPRSPEIAIGAVLDPMVKKDFFRHLIKAAGMPVAGQIYLLREDLAMLRKKCRLIEWPAVEAERRLRR